MAIRIWRGDAQPTPQVDYVTPATIEPGDTFSLTINRKTITVTADADGELTDAGTATQANLVDDVINRMQGAIGVYNNTIPEFAEIAATLVLEDDPADPLNPLAVKLKLTGPQDGKPFTVSSGTTDAGNQGVSVTTVVDGDPGTNEIQVVQLAGTPTGGTFTLTFQGQTTGTIAYNASAATVETALEALSNIVAGDVSVTGNAGGPWTIEFLQAYAATDVALIKGDGTNLTGAPVVQVLETTKGGGANEKWSVTWSSNPNVTDIKLKVKDGYGNDFGETQYISTASSQDLVETRIEALDASFVGNINVVKDGNKWTIEYVGDWAALDVPDDAVEVSVAFVPTLMPPERTTDADSYVTVTKVQDGEERDEVQTVTLLHGPVAGTFTLTYDGQTTGTIAYNATAATVETALEALSNITGVVVSGNAGGPWTVTFDVAPQAGTDVSLMTGNASGLTGSAVLAEVDQEAVVATNEIQRVELTGGPMGGTFTLTFNSETTGAIAYDATAATVETALEALATPVAGDFEVLGAAGGPWTVEFLQNYAGTDVSAMTGDGSNLTSGGSQTFTLETGGSGDSVVPTGPNWWPEANNWQTPGTTTATAPTTGDVVIFEDNEIDCLYGLEDLNSDTLAQLHARASYTGAIGLEAHNGLYYEYRPTALQVNATLVVIGEGEGSGSARILCDFQAAQSTIYVHQTGTPEVQEAAFIWQGTHVSNVMHVYRGKVGVGTEKHGDAAKLATMVVGYKENQDTDAEVYIGEGVSQLTTCSQLGGNVVMDTGSGLTITTYTKTGGILDFGGEGAITTLLELEGATYYQSSGTCTLCEIGDGGELHFNRDLRSRTFTTVIMESGSTLLDPARTVTFTNGIDLRNTKLEEVTLDVGTDVNLVISAAS